MFSDERLTDNGVQFPETFRDFNSRPATALVRVARDCINAQPRVQRASLLRADSCGITIAAENTLNKMLLRIFFESQKLQAELGLDVIDGPQRRQSRRIRDVDLD